MLVLYVEGEEKECDHKLRLKKKYEAKGPILLGRLGLCPLPKKIVQN